MSSCVYFNLVFFGSQSVTNLTTSRLKNRPAKQLSRSSRKRRVVVPLTACLPKQSIALTRSASVPFKKQQEASSQKEIAFRFWKDIQSEKGWRFDILCMRSPGVKGICADTLLCDSLSCQSLRFVVEARYSTEPVQ